ncbi:MAG: imidazole glycerol phosphate synthase subunit HisF [Oscillospiraceae bacterium]|nr:imidazole glycerol phosphate synthase subunit HisF [Oscillospiraceae bacterium]
MSFKRIIPCLDMAEGKVVKGVNFVGIREVGDPAELAALYVKQGADELVLLDINATADNRGIMLEAVSKTADNLSIPITVGGGIRTLEDIHDVLLAGADKVSINSAAVKNPELIREAALKFGCKRIVIAIDTKKTPVGGYSVVVSGGRVNSGLDVIEWAKQCEELGAGEILLTSMDADGVKNGYDIEPLGVVCDAVKIPVIASGGCGKLSHFVEVFEKTCVSAALAASVFHFNELTVCEVKEELKKRGISVRS